MKNEVKFMYNGIKINGKLVKGTWNYDYKNTIMFGTEQYSKDLRENFNVENDTDIMTDYFDFDSITFTSDDKNYNEVFNAWKKQEIKLINQGIKHFEKQILKGKDFYKNSIKQFKEKLERIEILEVA